MTVDGRGGGGGGGVLVKQINFSLPCKIISISISLPPFRHPHMRRNSRSMNKSHLCKINHAQAKHQVTSTTG